MQTRKLLSATALIITSYLAAATPASVALAQFGPGPQAPPCTPYPLCAAQPQGQGGSTAPAPTTVTPPDLYGAFAASDSLGFFNMNARYQKKSRAQKEALERCRTDSKEDCHLLGVVKNKCGSVAASATGKTYLGVDALPVKAAMKALQSCHEKTPGKACDIVVAPYCSSPFIHSSYNSYHDTMTREKERRITSTTNRLLNSKNRAETEQLYTEFDNLRYE